MEAEYNFTASMTLMPLFVINNNFFFYLIGFLLIAFILVLSTAVVLTRDSHNVIVLENPNSDVHSQQRVLVAFKTSPLCGSGCTDNSIVSMVVSGVKGESSTFVLTRQQYPYRKFLRGNLDLFLMHFDEDIGYVRGIKLIIDNHETTTFSWHINEISTYDPDNQNKVHFVIPDNKAIRCSPQSTDVFHFKPCVIRPTAYSMRGGSLINKNHISADLNRINFYIALSILYLSLVLVNGILVGAINMIRTGSRFTRVLEFILTNHYVISIASPVNLRNFGRVARCIFVGFLMSFLCFSLLVTYVMIMAIQKTVTRLEYFLFSHITYVIVFTLSYLCALAMEHSCPKIFLDKFPETRRGKLGCHEDEVVQAIAEPPKSVGVSESFRLNTINESDETLAVLNYDNDLLKSKLWYRRMNDEMSNVKDGAPKGSYGFYEKQTKGELQAIQAYIKDQTSSKSSKDKAIKTLSKEVVGKILSQAKLEATITNLAVETNKLRRHYKRNTAGDEKTVDTKLTQLYILHDKLRFESCLELYLQLQKSKQVSYNDMANFANTQEMLISCAEKLGNLQSYHSGKLEKFYGVPYFRVDPSGSVKKSLRARPELSSFSPGLNHDPKTVYRSTSDKIAVDIKQTSSFESPDHVTIHSLPQISHTNRLGIAADAIVDYAVKNAKDLMSTHTVTSIRDNLQKFCDILLKQILKSPDQKSSPKTTVTHNLLGYKRLIEHFAKSYVTNEIRAQNAGMSLQSAMTDELFFPTRDSPQLSNENYVFSIIFMLAKESFSAGLRGDYEPGFSPLTTISKIKGKTKDKETAMKKEEILYAASPLIPDDAFSVDRRQILAHLKVNPHFKQILIDVIYGFTTGTLAEDVIIYIEKIVSMYKEYDMLNETSNFLAKKIQQLVTVWKELQKNDNFVVDTLLILLAADLRDNELDPSTLTLVRQLFKALWKNVTDKQKSLNAEKAKQSTKEKDVMQATKILCPKVIARAIDETFVELENPIYMFHKAIGIVQLLNILSASSKSVLKADWIKKSIADAKLHYDKQGYFRIENTGEFLSRSMICEYLSGRLNKQLERDINEQSPNLDKFNVLLLKRIEYYFLVNITEKYKDVANSTAQKLVKVLDQELRFCQHIKCKRDYLALYIIQCIDRMTELCKHDPIIILAQILRNQLIETRRAVNLQHLSTTVNKQQKKIDVTKDLTISTKSPDCKELVSHLLDLRDQLKFMDRISEATDKIARNSYITKEQPFLSDQVMVNMQQVIDSRNMYVINDETRAGLWYFRSIIIGEHKNTVSFGFRQIMIGFMWAVMTASIMFTACKGVDLMPHEAASWTAAVIIGIAEEILIFEMIRLVIVHALSRNWRLARTKNVVNDTSSSRHSIVT